MAIRTTQKLMCKLTQEEIDERSLKASQLDQEKRKKADEKKGSVKIFNEQLKHLDKQIAELTEVATRGEELREVECEERPGLVNGVNGTEVWRLDTNEIVDSWTDDPEDDAPEGDGKQPGLPFDRPEVPRLLCTAIDADGECHAISAEQADAGELEINDTGTARLTIGERTVVAVRIARGKPCETCGLVGGDHRPECADLKKADAVIDGEDGKSIDEIADEVADSLEEYDRNDTAQVAAKIAEGGAPPDGPVRGVETATTKVKPRKSKKGAAGAEAE